MKNLQKAFDFSSELPKIKGKKQDYSNVFELCEKLVLCDKRLSSQNLNAISVSPELYKKYNAEKMVLFNRENGSFLNVKLQLDKGIQKNSFSATPNVKEVLNLQTDSVALLCSYNDYLFKRVYTQRIDYIRENTLSVSKQDYNGLFLQFEKSPFHLFEVYNTLTKDSIIIKKSHIVIDESLPAGTIKMNRKQRLWLGLELPLYFTDTQWDLLTHSLKDLPEDLAFIKQLYTAEDYFLKKDIPYKQQVRAKSIIEKHCKGDIRIIPVLQSFETKNKRSILRKITDFYVGKSTLSLLARRPYEIDEGSDVVRMTKSNMHLLGVTEMDKVILQYKDKKISCRVLEINDKKAFQDTNLPINADLAIGVPANIRKKLGLTDISSAIKVDRDTAFIFKKSINEQVIPILLTLFSANFFTDSSVLLTALISIIGIPLVLYLNLSSKRNMRS